MKETTTIYWSSLTDLPCPSDQWIFKDPEPVINYFLNNNTSQDRDSFFSCPAARSFFNNLFVFRSNVDDQCIWPEGYLAGAVNKNLGPLDNFGNIIDIIQSRNSAVEGYIDLLYNGTFVMFADKSLKIRISSPSYPPSAPSPGAMFTSGEFDIGRWFRPATLNWFVPLQNTEFIIKQNDPLFYAQALTDNKIIFKKFMITDNIKEIAQYFRSSTSRDGRNIELEKRYKIAESHNIQEILLKQIKNNLVD